jgi:hypothetical protein
MKEETLKKAHNLEHAISEYTDLLHSRKADYYTMLIKISCAYANMRDEFHGRVDKEVWDKMLDVVEEERTKARRRLAALSDDSEEGAEADVEVEIDEDAAETTAEQKQQSKRKCESFWRTILFLLGVIAGMLLGHVI